MKPTEITFLSAGELAQRIKVGELSARQVVDAHIRRIEEVNERLNAVVVRLFDQARKQADAADAAQRSGASLGALHGVPITLKEVFLVKDTPTTFGLLNQRDHRAAEDGPLVKRLRDAGAIILGKTNVPQLLLYQESDSPLYGRTNNPWNLDRSSGGSSGGEAAIIAAGGSPLGFGTDYGGSLREPAHMCGIHAFKPTAGRLTNLDTRPDIMGIDQTLVPQPGPMARSVADLTLAMSVLAAPGLEMIDATIPPVPWRDPASVDIKALRVAMYTDDGDFSASPALRRAVHEAADALRRRGAQVEEWQPPDVAQAVGLFLSIASAGGATPFKRALQRDRPAPQLAGLLQVLSVPASVRRALATVLQTFGQTRLPDTMRALGKRTTLDFWALLEERTAYRARFLSALDAGRFDAVISPPVATPAVLHGSTPNLADFDSYSRVYSFLGMPAGVVAATRVRAGEESDRTPGKDIAERTARAVEEGSAGLPIGVQVASRYWREDVALAVMAALEEHFGMQPDYPARPPI